MSQQLPQQAEIRIKDIQQNYAVPQDALLKEYQEILQDAFIREDPQFKTEEDRLIYASNVLWTRYVGRPPAKEFSLIPVGFFGKRTTKAGASQSTLFALIYFDGGQRTELKRISFKGEASEVPANVTQMSLYNNIKLGVFKSGDLSADNRAKFEKPTSIQLPEGISLSGFYEKMGSKRVTIAKAKDFPSLKTSDGYTVQTDWRIIRAFIVSKNNGVRKDGAPWQLYVIADETVDATPRLDPKTGEEIRPGLTVWVDEKQHIYNESDECDFVGTVSVDDKGIASMNVVAILPLRVRRAKS